MNSVLIAIGVLAICLGTLGGSTATFILLLILFGQDKIIPGRTKYRTVGPDVDCHLEYECQKTLFGITLPGTNWAPVPRPYYNAIVGRSDVHCSADKLYLHGRLSFIQDVVKQYPSIQEYLKNYEKDQKAVEQSVKAEHARIVQQRTQIKQLS